MNRIVFARRRRAEVGSLIAAYLAKHDIDVIVEPRGDRAEGSYPHHSRIRSGFTRILCRCKDGMTICRDLRQMP